MLSCYLTFCPEIEYTLSSVRIYTFPLRMSFCALLAGLAVVGAIPSLVDVGGVEYDGALAVENGQLVVYNAFANRSECAIGDVSSIGRYDVGNENRFG